MVARARQIDGSRGRGSAVVRGRGLRVQVGGPGGGDLCFTSYAIVVIDMRGE